MTVERTGIWRRWWPWLPLACVTVLLAFAAWEGTLPREAPRAHWSVLATIACALIAAVAAGRHVQHKSSAAWLRDGLGAIGGDITRRTRRPAALVAGVATWAALILAPIGWDLYSFTREVRYLPTLSRLFGDVTDHDWGRALVFAGWLALGAYLTFGWRRGRKDALSP